MATAWIFLVSFLALWTLNFADQVDSKADAMVNAIAEQNKKVEQESNAMVRAINEKGKLINTEDQEEKFKKASDRTDAVEESAEKKLEQKSDLVDEVADDANSAIENQAKKVEALGNQAGSTENHASKQVDKVGKRIPKVSKTEKPGSRMSISYTVHVPHEPPTAKVLEKSLFNEVQPTSMDEKSGYPWPLQEQQGYPPPFSENQEDGQSDISLKPFKVNNAEVDHDALMNDAVADSPSIRRNYGGRRRVFYFPRHHRRRGRHHHLRRYPHHLPLPFLHPLKGYDRPLPPKTFRPTSKSSDLGLLVLPSGGPQQLSEDVRNQLEDDELLRKAAKQAFNNDEDMDITNEMKKTAAEQRMERKWMAMNAIGSPEMLLHWPRMTKKLGAIGQQQVSIVSPGEIDLLQTEYPEYPRPKALGSDMPGVQRSVILQKRKSRQQKKAKQFLKSTHS